MHIVTRNVNTAFHTLVSIFHEGTANIVKKDSRNGPVMMIEEPVIITYTHPRERVLFNSARDANPFFHLYEALWMLAGRFDVKSVAYYASNMKNYSDDGITLNGAYGHRWRCGIRSDEEGNFRHDVDQIQIIINHLRTDPNSRRAVLQMWNVEDDLLKIGGLPAGVDPTDNSLFRETKPSKDVCCNLSVMFSLRLANEIKTIGYLGPWPESPINYRLDMTVTNRSNDMIWGLLGANYVHFTFLQEYMAAALGVEVGVYHHFTNNLHVYENNWKPEYWLEGAEVQDYGYHIGAGSLPEFSLPNGESNSFIRLVKDQATFDREVKLFCGAFNGEEDPIICVQGYKEPFLEMVAKPALMAFYRYKTMKDKTYALGCCKDIKSDDWRLACTQWLELRINKQDSSTACVGITTDQLKRGYKNVSE